MKEYIDILNKNGQTQKAEIVFRFRDEKTNNYYLVYKIDNDYLAAKYDDVIGYSSLDTNLTEKELEVLEKFLNELPEV